MGAGIRLRGCRYEKGKRTDHALFFFVPVVLTVRVKLRKKRGRRQRMAVLLFRADVSGQTVDGHRHGVGQIGSAGGQTTQVRKYDGEASVFILMKNSAVDREPSGLPFLGMCDRSPVYLRRLKGRNSTQAAMGTPPWCARFLAAASTSALCMTFCSSMELHNGKAL